jgi:hypothetical protein
LSGHIAALNGFGFDYLGTKVCENHRTVWTGQGAGQIEHTKAGKR